MKIVLAEESANGGKLPEKSFDQNIIRVGRAAGECDIPFDHSRFPMVSRRHAELRFERGRWLVVDTDSSYGTFVNGQKIESPTEISAGKRLQFGINGPILIIEWTENSAVDFNFEIPVNPFENPPKGAAHPPKNERLPIPNFDTSPKSHSQVGQPNKPEPARLEFVGEHQQPPFLIDKSEISLGRDTNCDVRFEPSAVMVSRRHADIRRANDGFSIYDNGSFNGTLINGQRISGAVKIYHDDEIQLGIGGPILRFKHASQISPKQSNSITAPPNFPEMRTDIGSKTMAINLATLSGSDRRTESAKPQLLMSLIFGGSNELTVGRDEHNDIRLDGLQISNRHAKLVRTNSGISVEDLGSTNGVYINGKKISRQIIGAEDSLQIGTFLIRVDGAGNVNVFDTRAKTRIDAVNLTKTVKNRAGGGQIKLLDDVSLSIAPNEFVGLLGPSGAGKSTLMDAMNGMRSASSGSVLINNLDLYQNLGALKQSIGYVPQDDIIHRELTVERTLYYVAKLRLSRDVSAKEIRQIIDEVLDVTGLSERRKVPISQLSGGQRKRVSIAVELITKPSIIFLDEPTSGLDPATEEKIMKLFRQIAESGRTVILTTHAMENVKLFDKIVVLMRGKLAFYGAPDEALKYLNANSFKELYDKLEAPVEAQIAQHGETGRAKITEQTAQDWKQKFTRTPQYRQNVEEPLKKIGKVASQSAKNKNRLGVFGAVRQFLTLSRRYAEVLFKDKLTLFILLIQAPIIALMTFLVMGKNDPRDFVYFMLSLIAVWFGTSIAAREIVRESAVYRRERMVNLGILPYLGSKFFVLGIIVGGQCLLLFVPLKIFDLLGVMPMPGEFFGIPQLWTMFLTAAVGIALGLLVSALVKTSEMATSLVPLILIPQILFAGLVGVPGGINKVVGLTMPAAWSFDTMKRFSTLDTLEEEGAEPNGKTRGKGLYKSIEADNEKLIADAKKDLDAYKKNSEAKIKAVETDARNGQTVTAPELDDPPKIADAKQIPKDLSNYIKFLHPWMNEVLNQLVLMLMFFVLAIIAIIVLRLQDLI